MYVIKLVIMTALAFIKLIISLASVANNGKTL